VRPALLDVGKGARDPFSGVLEAGTFAPNSLSERGSIGRARVARGPMKADSTAAALGDNAANVIYK